MSRQWTAAQSTAINTKNKTLLVSAAAGSGKTATLTERIIRSLTDPTEPADISKMLIVTFTRAAADELKSRIFSALSEALAKNPSDRHLTSQLIKLGNAHICTIDSFYLELVRSNFSVLGLSASFRIADTSELEILEKSVMEETVEFMYETNEAFPAFAECFTGTRSADKLSEVLLKLMSHTVSVPEGIEFLRLSAEQTAQDADCETDFFNTKFGAILRRQAIDLVEHCFGVFSASCEAIAEDPILTNAMLPSFSYDESFCRELLTELKSESDGYLHAKTKLEHFEPIRLKGLKAEFKTENSENLKDMRKKLHDSLRDMAKNSFSKEPAVISRALADTAHYTELLYLTLREYEMRITAQKSRRNILDFNDIRRQTLRLLVNSDGTPTEIALQYAEQFSDIYIDEYQDVDPVQDLIFRAISRPTNRFMVGDIKQSIYSFRGAEPQVFSNYRSTFPHMAAAKETDESMTVFMSENFRCDSSVIDFTNLVCSRIFSACTDSIGYRSDDDLVFAKKPPYEDYHAPLVEVAVILQEKAEDNLTEESVDSDSEAPEKKQLEAIYIAEEICRLLAEEVKADGTPFLPGDIAVLFRSRSMSEYLSRELNQRGILTSESDGVRYFENPDVLMVLCLLNTVDNPHRDIFLTGTLRSPLFGFDMNDLIRIRQSCDASFSLYDALVSCKDGEDELALRCRRFDEVLLRLRQHAMALPVDRFLRVLFESEEFIASGLLDDGSGAGTGGNLLRLYEYARTFEAGTFKGLCNFIEFINTIIEEDRKLKIPPKGSSPDRVNLMTVHQSKGLEFPVCFLCGCANRFNRKDQQADLLFEYPTGIAMKIADSTGFARINTPMREALAANLAMKQTEEEMRVLYVALTRARERLYVTAVSPSTEEKLMQQAAARASFCDRHTLLRCNSYLDWILIPFADPMVEPHRCRLSFVAAVSKATDVLVEEVRSPKTTPMAKEDPALTEHLRQVFAFRYPYADLRRIPAKLSVSRLSPTVLDENDTSVSLFEEEKKAPIPDFFMGVKNHHATAAERGTATHLFFQFCDFSRIQTYGVREEIARLTEKRFLPSNIAELIHVEDLERFLNSDLLAEIQRAKSVIREQRFNLFLSPELFTEDSAFAARLTDEKLAVQGVIDLILITEDNRLCLYDYKTDRLSKLEQADPSLAAKRMNELHGLQLSYYAHAAALLFDRPCDRLCVYATHVGRLFDIAPRPLAVPKETIDIL